MKTYLSWLSAASVLFAASFVMLGGCGGSGGVSPDIVRNSTFAGNYSGVTVDEAGNISTLTISITSAGAATGVANSPGNTTTITGHINNAGFMSVTATDAGSGTKTVRSGTFTMPTGATISGLLESSDKAKWVYVILLVNPAAPQPGGNPYNGNYAGTMTDTQQSGTEPIAFKVDATGNISGSVLIEDNGAQSVAVLTGTVNSEGGVNVTVTVNGITKGTATGTTNLSSGQLTGTLTTNGGGTLTLILKAIP